MIVNGMDVESYPKHFIACPELKIRNLNTKGHLKNWPLSA